MMRLVSFTAVCIAITSLSACSTGEAGENNSANASPIEPVSGDTNDPTPTPTPTPTPAPCDEGATNCPAPAPTPCDESASDCPVPAPSWCETTANELDILLAAARSCNIASAAVVVCDGTVVPTITGCGAPVASGSSDVTLKYLELFKAYAAKCPIAVPPCPDPKTLKIDCVQSPDIDSLQGACSFVAPTATDGASE